jgi:hypothetical protein
VYQRNEREPVDHREQDMQLDNGSRAPNGFALIEMEQRLARSIEVQSRRVNSLYQTRLVTGARGPGAGVWESSPDSWSARPSPDAAARRIDRTLVRAPL